MNAHLRRGACPGLSAPMPTGDGLLARLTPSGETIGLDAFAGLCAAAQQHGNGIIEVTSRGSIQVRGLTPASSSIFAAAVAELGIAAHDGIPVIVNPLSGLDPDEMLDARAVAATLRDALGTSVVALNAKASIVIDGGGALHLDQLRADVRLRAHDGRWHVATTDSALKGLVSRVIGERAASGALPPRAAPDPVGTHRLRDNRTAAGIALPFGHSDAATLMQLIDAVRRSGATGLRTAPSRALLLIDAKPEFTAEAKRLGFIVDPRDPRRRVVACAGAPICASAEIPARTLAPLATDAAAHIDGIIHISGCAKGCAHHGTAAITVIGRDGRCDIVGADTVSVEALPQRLVELVHHERLHPRR